MSNDLIYYCADAKEFLKTISDEYINCGITSPPYWRLRNYGPPEQLGLEATPQEYLGRLWDVFDEFKRTLKKDGTLWVNIGDVYNNATPGSRDPKRWPKQLRNNHTVEKAKIPYPKKCLFLIPEHFVIGMVERRWICRNVIIWHKPNRMPSSAKDRLTVDFENVYLFTKQKKYYFKTLYELAAYDGRKDTIMKGSPKYKRSVIPGKKEHSMALGGHERWTRGPDGEFLRIKRCVWRISNARTKEAHFAIFPEALVEPMIKAGCPQGGVVWDGFMGTGTTAIVAKKLGCKFVGSDINPEYIQIVEKRRAETFGLFK